MEEVSKTQEPQALPQTPEDQELQKVYQEYLQKCCEAGQIIYNISQLESQLAEMQKTLDVTNSAAKKAATKHRELQKAKFSKLKPVDSNIELKEAH